MLKNDFSRSKLFWMLALLCFLSLFLFIGQTYFNTRGEPREALVGMAMLESGNWTLPITNGVDMAYKPPLFHWCIAMISSIVGEVNEYTSRMPSAIALATMVLGGFMFYAKRRSTEVAFLMGLITLTNFEVHRAGIACRVDMLLSALMVLALYELFKWAQKQLRGIPWLGILFLSGAFLTKGPVGMVLPCMVVGVYSLIRGTNFFRAFLSFAAVAVASIAIPMLWYVAAWRQGGDAFLNLVIEENVLRFLGKMTYASHINPWHYNVMTIVAGFVPYTILFIISLFTIRKVKVASKPKEWWSKLTSYIKDMDDTRLFSLLSIVIMFVFYCIPKSKRSVYLLPVYPFIAYFIAEYIVYLAKNKPKVVNIYNGILYGVGILLTVVFFAVKLGAIPHTMFHGKHAAENIAFVSALEELPLGMNLIMILLPLVLGIVLFRARKSLTVMVYGGGIMAFALFFSLDGVFLPSILNTKSNIVIAERLKKEAPKERVYSYITNMADGNRLHPFTVNFYMNNQVVPFEESQPEKGVLLLGEEEYDVFIKNYGKEYALEEWSESLYKSCDNRKMTRIYSFRKI